MVFFYGALKDAKHDNLLYKTAIMNDNMTMLKTVKKSIVQCSNGIQLVEEQKRDVPYKILSVLSLAAQYNRVQALAYLLVNRPLLSELNMSNYISMMVI